MEDMAAARRNPRLRFPAFSDNMRNASGTGPESIPAPRMAQPVAPDLSGWDAAVVLLSIDNPMNVSIAAAPSAILFNASESFPASSRIDEAADAPDAAK